MAEMTSRQRLDRCFKHLEVDRPGLFIRGVSWSYPAHESYKPLRDLVLAKGDLKAIYHPGILKGGKEFEHRVEKYTEDYSKHVFTMHTPAGDLTKVVMDGLKGQPSYIAEHFVKTPEDAEKYLSMFEDEFALDAGLFSELDRKMGDRGIVAAEIVNNPAGTIVELLGSETFAIWSIEDRELLHELIKRELKSQLKLVKQLVDNKIGPYYQILGQEYITPPLHGRSDFFDFNVQYDRQIAELIHNSGGYLHVHCHGPIKRMLDGFIEIGADVLHPIEAPPMGDVTAKEAKDVLRGKVCIEGNVQIGDMYESTPEEIRSMALNLMDNAFDDSRDLIVCPTASPFVHVMSARAYENYRTLIETVLAYR